jgi:hypothetical protein
VTVPEYEPVPTLFELNTNSEPEAVKAVPFPEAVPAIALTSVLPNVAPPQASPFSRTATVTLAPVEEGPCQRPSAVFTVVLPLPPPPHAVKTAAVQVIRLNLIFVFILALCLIVGWDTKIAFD